MIIPNGQAWVRYENGQALPGRYRRSHEVHAPVGTLLRRRRQRNRAIGKRVQIGDHVGALAVPRDAGKAHRGAWNKALGIRDELAEGVKAPLATLGLHRRREIEPAALALLVAADGVKLGADAVVTVFLDSVAGSAVTRKTGPPLLR